MFPRPTTLGIDQRAINCRADSTCDGAEARNFVTAGKTDTCGTKRTSIEAASVALDISPMSVGLDSENGPPGLPVSSELASEKPATDRVRSLGRANVREGSRIRHLSRDRGQRRVLIPAVLFVTPAGTATDTEIDARPAKPWRGAMTGALTANSAAPAMPEKLKVSAAKQRARFIFTS
jgi:hypothetical protein